MNFQIQLTKQRSWAKFVAHRESEAFKEISEKAKQKQACNEHPHFLGSAGYVGKQAEWKMSDPLSSQSSCASVNSSLLAEDRSFDWVRARIKKSDEGSYFIPNEKTQEVFHKIIQKCDEVNQGTFQPNRHHDILSIVLNKSEDKRGSGSVRGVGSYSTIRQVFGRPEQKQGRLNTDEVQQIMEKVRQNTLSEVQPQINMLTQQLHILMNNMSANHLRPQGVSIGTPQTAYAGCDQPPTRSSCHSVDVYSLSTIKSPKLCKLAICGLDGKPLVVAKGTVYPTTNETMLVQNQLLLPNHVKVTVDEVNNGAEGCNLPVPTLQYTTLGDILWSSTQWPTHLVSLDEENVKVSPQRKNTQMMRDQSVEQSVTATRSPIVGDNVFLLLGTYCKQLVSTLLSYPVDKDCVDLDLDLSVFHHANVNGLYVMMEDIHDLLTLNWLDVSIIQVFMMFLNKLCKQLGVTSIGFACPTQISADMVNLNSVAVTQYLIHVMDKHKDQQFILAPYHQNNHWILIVMSPPSKTVYVFDPMKSVDRNLAVKVFVNMAFRSIPGRGIRTVDWKECRCPQQPGGSECGYYILRYMFEIVNKHSKLHCLEEIFEQPTYSINEIEEIRELWAQYFVDRCL